MSKKDELIEKLENLKWCWDKKLAVPSFFVYNAKKEAYLSLHSDGLYLCENNNFRLDILSEWSQAAYNKLCYNVRLKELENVLLENAIDDPEDSALG